MVYQPAQTVTLHILASQLHADRQAIKLPTLRLPRTARTLLSPEPAPGCGAAMCSPTPRARVPWPGKPSEPSDENNTVRLVRVRGDGRTCDRQKARPRTARVSANEANEADEVTAQHLAAAVLPDLDSQNGQMEVVHRRERAEDGAGLPMASQVVVAASVHHTPGVA
jgi:hypothetical protein